MYSKNETNRSMKQNKIHDHLYGQLIHDKQSKNNQWREESLFNKWCWKNVALRTQKSTGLYTAYKKINSIWSKGLNVIQTIKFLKTTFWHSCRVFSFPFLFFTLLFLIFLYIERSESV